MSTEGIDMEGPDFFLDSSTGDFGDEVISHFLKSDTEDTEDRQRLCAAIGTMSQELKEQKLPLTAMAYFGATCSTLDRLCSQPDSPRHAIQSLTTILSLALPAIPVAVLGKNRDYVSKVVVTVLRLNSVTEVTLISGFKCLSHLLIFGEKDNWSDLSQNYGIILGFVTDSRPKVREQVHIFLGDVLESFQGMPVLAPASEAITNLLERLLPLAGGSSANEVPYGAQEVLHVLDALEISLQFMSSKYMTTILKCYKTLLELRQPLVTWRLTSSINIPCTCPSVEVSAEALLDLLSLVAFSVADGASVGMMYADEASVGMKYTALFLGYGMKNVYSLSRQLCVVNLPIVFSALKDILGSKQKSAAFDSVIAFQTLINGCIDEGLIKEGMDHFINSKSDDIKSEPTVIERVCATIESLLDYHYKDVWDLAFKIVSAMFDVLGYYSLYFMKGTLKKLAGMLSLPNEDHILCLRRCVGSALGALGLEAFLGFFPLNLEANAPSDVNVELFRILEQHIVGAHLSFFNEVILGLIGEMKQRSQNLELAGEVFASKEADDLVLSLWSLLPSFCNYPLDTAQSFRDLLSPLCSAVSEYCVICRIICKCLQILIQQNRKIIEGKGDLDVDVTSRTGQRVMAHYTPEIAKENLKVLAASAPQLLSVLSKIFMKSTVHDDLLKSTIRELASIAHRNDVTTLFQKTMVLLLGWKIKASMNDMQIGDDFSTKNSQSIERVQLADLAVSLLPGLDEPELDVLFSAIKPTLPDMDDLIKKNSSNKLVAMVLTMRHEFISAKMEELLKLMIKVLPSLQLSAKRHRHEILSSFVTGSVLALKEVHKESRNVASIHPIIDDEDDDVKQREDLLNTVTRGVAGVTPHMISDALKSLARLAYDLEIHI